MRALAWRWRCRPRCSRRWSRFLLLGQPLRELTGAAPPVEELSVEAARLTPGLISLTRARRRLGAGRARAGAGRRRLARRSALTPDGPIGRLGTARLDIPYPWVDGETHHVALAHRHRRRLRPHDRGGAGDARRSRRGRWRSLTLVGLLLGVAPVAIGLLAYPALRAPGRRRDASCWR